MSNLLNDWKTKAIEKMAMQHNKDDVERAFMDQAYGYIQNKAGRLLTDPHRLGFEIVYKNDANTRLVGMFAFRAKDKLLYAPCFFVNGDVKGTDLLYDQKTKMFKPLTEEWVEYMLETNNPRQGAGYKGDKSQLSRSVDLRRLVVPPSGRGFYEKGASIQLPVQDVLKEMGESRVLGPILKDFIVNDGREGALETLEKLASDSEEFLRALATLDVDTFAPELPRQEKQASEPPGELILITGYGPLAKSASVQENLVKRGFDMADNRKNTTPVEVDNIELQNISETGSYDVLLSDGSVQTAVCLVGTHRQCVDNAIESNCIESNCDDHYYKQEKLKEVLVIFPDGTATKTKNVNAFGRLSEDMQAMEKASDKEGQVGKFYVIYSPSVGTYAYCKVNNKRTRNGIITYSITGDISKYYAGEIELIQREGENNPCFSGATWRANKDLMFFPLRQEPKNDYTVRPEAGKNLGDAKSLDRFLLSHNMLPAELRSQEKSAGVRYTLRFLGKNTTDMDDKSMAVKLANALKIPAEQTMTLLDKADSNGTVRFWMEKEKLEKSGGMRLAEEPDFQNEYDADYGTEVDPGHAYRLSVDGPQEQFPGQNIGDVASPEGYDPAAYKKEEGLPMEVLLGQSPEQLAQLAQFHQLPNLFEHGVVGALTNSSNATGMIEKYVPEMEKALDAIARCLFLFFWKPGEFQDVYGLDDMQNLEEELISNFQSLGDLTLSLLKKGPKKYITANSSAV